MAILQKVQLSITARKRAFTRATGAHPSDPTRNVLRKFSAIPQPRRSLAIPGLLRLPLIGTPVHCAASARSYGRPLIIFCTGFIPETWLLTVFPSAGRRGASFDGHSGTSYLMPSLSSSPGGKTNAHKLALGALQTVSRTRRQYILSGVFYI